MNVTNQVFEVLEGDDFAIEAGSYPAKFVSVDLKEEGKHGPYYEWTFDGSDKTYKGFADKPKGGPTIGNKLGRLLCGLAGRPLSAGQVNPKDYVGKPYMLVYAPNKKNGKVSLESITPM